MTDPTIELADRLHDTVADIDQLITAHHTEIAVLTVKRDAITACIDILDRPPVDLDTVGATQIATLTVTAGQTHPWAGTPGTTGTRVTVKQTTSPPVKVKQIPDPPAKYDFEQIALWIYAAKSNGTYSTQALADRFDVPVSTAKNWPGRCRADGYNIDPPTSDDTAPPPTPRPDQPSSRPHLVAPAVNLDGVDLAEVAATYKEAFTVGRRPIQTIIDRYDIDRPTARAWVAAARTAGHLPPRDEPPVEAEGTQQIVRHTNRSA